MKKRQVLTASDAVEEAMSLITTHDKEHFIGLYLNARNEVIYKEAISIGTVNATMVHPRETYRPAIKKTACSIVTLHNHPSGCVEPSADDLSIKNRLEQAGAILRIEMLDFIVFDKGSKYHSTKEYNQ